MADTKITALTALTAADPANDVIPIVDVSDTTMAASGTTKKISVNNILGASGTATLASATITGDLTVDTSTLKVDSTNNRVIVGHTSGSAAFQVTNAGAAGLEIQPTGFSSAPLIQSYNRSGSAYTQLTLDASTIVHALSGTTAMTLNSTGLGVGGSPSAKIHLFDSTPQISLTDTSNSNYRYSIQNAFSALRIFNNTTSTEVCRFDASGNVGIGITPSAWATATTIWRALDLQYSCGIASSGAGSGEIDFLWNAYYDQTDQRWEFKYTGDRASRYAIGGAGVHTWYNTASTGTANAPITWVPAMTLDASGTLLVGKTASSATTVGVQLESVGSVVSTLAASTSATNTLIVYSTGAAAYRFYVGLGGTVNATNATISAISDARFKENVQDIDVGLNAILSLKPRKFDWKAGKGKDIKGDRGFIAQEFETVFPNLIDEWKDPAPEGEAPYKSVRQDLIPVLVKAIQELTARVQTLEAR